METDKKMLVATLKSTAATAAILVVWMMLGGCASRSASSLNAGCESCSKRALFENDLLIFTMAVAMVSDSHLEVAWAEITSAGINSVVAYPEPSLAIARAIMRDVSSPQRRPLWQDLISDGLITGAKLSLIQMAMKQGPIEQAQVE